MNSSNHEQGKQGKYRRCISFVSWTSKMFYSINSYYFFFQYFFQFFLSKADLIFSTLSPTPPPPPLQ
uniref:Putative ovule protein n=1 Tax=Solanum chacoense TaxID=4108 RepID=A0A0V0H6I9_SOLCH